MRSPAVAAAFSFVLIWILIPTSTQFVPDYPKAVSELKDAIVKNFGLQGDGLEVFGFDLRDAGVGKSMVYEFDLKIGDGLVIPLKLLTDVKSGTYVDLPVFTNERHRIDADVPVLAPFQLAGPMELCIQDTTDMKLNLPDDVDAGALKKVILAGGVVVTINGARSVNMPHPVELPLPLSQTNRSFASNILNLGKDLQETSRSQQGPLFTLCIVHPTSLASSSDRLKLKQLGPGQVELSSASTKRAIETQSVSPIDLKKSMNDSTQFGTLWPAVSISGSNSTLRRLEALLFSVLGPKANEEGSLKLVKVNISIQTLVKMCFGVRRKLSPLDLEWELPEWIPKPDFVTMQFKVLASIDGDKLVPESVVPAEDRPSSEYAFLDRRKLLRNVRLIEMPSHLTL